VSFAHFPLVPLVIDIKKSELSFNNIPFNFKTLDEDKFKTMNNFLDLAMEKIDTKSPEERGILQDELHATAFLIECLSYFLRLER
jgi:hypothetical protein